MTKSKNMTGGQGDIVVSKDNSLPKEISLDARPFILIKPENIIYFISFFSPIILVILIVSMSFLFQNFKGLIYLGFILGVCIIRRYLLEISGAKQLIPDGTICTAVQFSKYGNSTISLFIFSFTLMYLCIPMFYNQSVNWLIFSLLIFGILTDIGIKVFNKCIILSKEPLVFIDILSGLGIGALITTIMYLTSNSKYLFFNETSSDKEICSMPKKQTFKCAVYKNGELVQ